MKKHIDWFFTFSPLLALFVILTAGFLLTPADLPKETLCLFKRIFLLDCPGCGLTRAFLCIPRGEWRAAVHYNAAAIPLYGFFLVGFYNQVTQQFPITRGHHIKFSPEFRFVMAQIIVGILLIQWFHKTYIHFL